MKLPFMPLFLGDLLADTLHLSAQEFGAYMLLILHAWKHEGAIAHKDARQIARVGYKYWPKVWAKLKPFFETEYDDKDFPIRHSHMRVTEELARAGEISSKRKDAALQMHAKRHANASHPHLHPLIESSLGKGREAPTVQPAPPAPVNYRDKGVAYRAPPAKKSDNELQPIPERPKADGWVK